MVDARCRSFPGSPRQFMRRGGASIEITHKVCCVLPHKEEGNATALVSVKESLYTHESIGRRLSHAVSSQTVPCYNSLIGVYALCRTRHKVFQGRPSLSSKIRVGSYKSSEATTYISNWDLVPLNKCFPEGELRLSIVGKPPPGTIDDSVYPKEFPEHCTSK